MKDLLALADEERLCLVPRPELRREHFHVDLRERVGIPASRCSGDVSREFAINVPDLFIAVHSSTVPAHRHYLQEAEEQIEHG